MSVSGHALDFISLEISAPSRAVYQRWPRVQTSFHSSGCCCFRRAPRDALGGEFLRVRSLLRQSPPHPVHLTTCPRPAEDEQGVGDLSKPGDEG